MSHPAHAHTQQPLLHQMDEVAAIVTLVMLITESIIITKTCTECRASAQMVIISSTRIPLLTVPNHCCEVHEMPHMHPCTPTQNAHTILLMAQLTTVLLQYLHCFPELQGKEGVGAPFKVPDNWDKGIHTHDQVEAQSGQKHINLHLCTADDDANVFIQCEAILARSWCDVRTYISCLS